MIKITVNGREVEADPARPLIDACHDNGAHVPHYCYHRALSPVGSCRICQVEVQQGDMPARVVAACRTPVAEGMVVNTEAERAHGARKECLEFILKNHPLDCPICDKAGECTLQDNAYAEGQDKCRSVEPRRGLAKRKSLGDVIVLDQERCILCSRCVRFMEEVPKTPQLAIVGRGVHSRVETWQDEPLSGNYQGNLADVCPVGALTLKGFRFQARVWNLRKTASTCPECSRGCSVTVEVLRNGEIKRVRPRRNADVNGFWMCDEGRLAFRTDAKLARLAGALLSNGGNLDPTGAARVIEVTVDLLATAPPALLLASPFITNEEAVVLQKLAIASGGRAAFVARDAESAAADTILRTGDPCPNRRGLTEAGLEQLSPAAAAAALAGAGSALLLGERIAATIGPDALAALPTTLRLVLFDTHLPEPAIPALNACLGIPDWSERSGTWRNIDGHHGQLLPARPAPAGTRPLAATLAVLADLVIPINGSPQVAAHDMSTEVSQ